jgi:hypothetical protein
MFDRLANLIRIIGEPDDQRPYKQSFIKMKYVYLVTHNYLIYKI